MGYNKPDVYYQPEAFDLEIVGTVDMDEPYYSFDMMLVVKDKDGRFGWGFDSGCSCPSPFETFTSIDDLKWGTAKDVADAFKAEQERGFYSADDIQTAQLAFGEMYVRMTT